MSRGHNVASPHKTTVVKGYKIPSPLLDDLSSRFILNIPDEYRESIIRICFQIELAHWFYIDFFVPEDPSLKAVGIRDFANQIFDHCPFLLTGDVESVLSDWKRYKLSVPTYGVILLDEAREYVLLVQGFSKSWGFPKGKVNEAESPITAATRELLEETGHDVTGQISEENCVIHQVGDQICHLFIVADVPLDTHFLPQTRHEIKNLQWFPLKMLPTHKKDVRHAEQLGCGPNSFFMVIPFLKQLKRWISQNPPGQKKTPAQINFAEQSVKEFEKILDIVTTPQDSPSMSPATRRKNKQYITKIRKDSDRESKRKLDEIRRKLNQHEGSSGPGRSPVLPEMEQFPIKPCKEWSNFKLDITAIVEKAMEGLPRLQRVEMPSYRQL